MRKKLTVVALVAVFLAGNAQAVLIETIDKGVLRSNLEAGAFNVEENYVAGWSNSFGVWADNRPFFVFDLTSIVGVVESARLLLDQPDNGFASPDTEETIEVARLTTPAAVLAADFSGVDAVERASIFDSLGNSAASYGTATASNADSGSVIEIALNDLALADINASLGGTFAIGGRLSSMLLPRDGRGGTSEYLFGFTNIFGNTGNRVRLEINAVDAPISVPEPGTAGLLLLGSGLAFCVRRRRQAALPASGGPRSMRSVPTA